MMCGQKVRPDFGQIVGFVRFVSPGFPTPTLQTKNPHKLPKNLNFSGVFRFIALFLKLREYFGYSKHFGNFSGTFNISLIFLVHTVTR